MKKVKQKLFSSYGNKSLFWNVSKCFGESLSMFQHVPMEKLELQYSIIFSVILFGNKNVVP